MEVVLIAVAISLANVICFATGLKAGSNRSKSEGRNMLNPVEKVKEHREQKEQQQEYKQRQEAVKTMLHNIDVYDGTDAGQKDVMY